jgi:hypothetical protein
MENEEENDERALKNSRNFAQKQAAIEHHKKNTINASRARDGLTSLVTSITSEASQFYDSLKDSVRPEFINRMSFKKTVPAKIAASAQ